MKSFKTTEEIEVPKKLIDQVIGQDKAVDIIKKAAKQKRNVLLIGSPGTGKSMLAQAMAELMPSQELEDVLVYKNINNENNPQIKNVKTYPDYNYLKKDMNNMKYYDKKELAAVKHFSLNNENGKIPGILKIGLGRRVVNYREKEEEMEKGPSPVTILLIVGVILAAIIFLVDIEENVKWLIVAALLGLSFLYIISGATAGLTRRLSPFESSKPKIIVDNSEKNTAPFVDATGTRAGALLGDIRHDPLQCFFPLSTTYKIEAGKPVPVQINEVVEKLLTKYPERIETDEKYKGLFLPEDEEIYVLGYKDGEIKPVRVLAVNKREHEGKMNHVRYKSNNLIVTPEHKIYANGNYIEAQQLGRDRILITHEEAILTKDNIIKTFSDKDQKSAYNYYKFLKIKERNPEFGYKRIAKILGIKEGQTRWWNNKKSIPKAVGTVERLEKLGLLPLYPKSKHSPAIARILGTTLGDGGIFSTFNAIFLSSSEEDSLNEYAQDLISIFGDRIGKNFERRISGINNTGMSVWNTNRDVVRYFIALGAPVGRKNKKLEIPKWIYLNEKTQKEFFGAFLGNELCSPKFSEDSNRIQYFGLGLAGEYSLKNNRIKILREISNYLASYGVKTSEHINQNEFRENKYIWRLNISIEIENVLRFHKFIPIRYSNNKIDRIRLAIEKTLERKKSKYNELVSRGKTEKYITSTLRATGNMMQKIISGEETEFENSVIDYSGTVYNITTESGNLIANGILAKNSGGMGTPAHLRVESGAIHRANQGVLFIDEIASLKINWQQELLTAMQEKKYPITGQSETSSGALVKTDPVPTDFVLVASGNLPDLKQIHPALRSRIRGAGYEIYMEDEMDDNEENENKLIRLVAQEIKKDKKIPHFTCDAVQEIVEEARKASGRKKKFTMNLRELGGLIRAAGDIAKDEKAEYVTSDHVNKARKVFTSVELQLGRKMIERKKDYQVIITEGSETGRVNGLAILGDPNAGLVLPLVAEITPASSKEEGKVIATGKLGDIAKEAVTNVSAIIKKYIGKDISQKDIHVQFLQTYEGVEGDSASISVAVAVISALTNIPVRQDFAMTGSLDVRGEVLPVGGVSGKITAAAESGIKNAVVPALNYYDIHLSKENRDKIKIYKVRNFAEVLQYVLKEGTEKRKLLTKIRKLFKE